MILIEEDKSYLSSLDLKAIANGVAELGIHSLRFENHLTDEQKQNNLEESKILSREQWEVRCEQKQREVGKKLKYIMDVLADEFIIYQYNKEIDFRSDDWDLFFWSNKGWNNKDYMNHATLNPNEKRTVEQQLTDINNTLDLLKTMEIEGIKVAIQYKAIYNEQKESEIALDYCEKMKDKFIVYGGWDGKIVKTDRGFFFRKKGAKKKQYYIDNRTILANVLV